MSTVAGGDIILAADNNDLENRVAAIEGRLTTTSATSNASATSGATELAIDQVTKTLVNGKVYKCTWTLNWTGTATDQFAVRQRFGSGIGGTQITSRTVAIGSQFGTDLISYFTAGSSGSLTVTGTVQRTSGSTSAMTVTGSATQPRFLTIELMS